MKAVFIGRFQPFHRGHHRVVEQYRGEYDDFALVMGSPRKSRSADNPLTAEERKEIIHACFPDLEILELEDEGPTEEDNERWARKLVETTGADVVLSQNELVKRLVEEYTDAELVEQELYDPERFSGTEVRRRMREGEDWRELVPECALETVRGYTDTVREAGR
ncbi:MAG: adenylyltransferase/cytidyltransferase family protein [Candidatus Nanohaloarchaea archaeon]